MCDKDHFAESVAEYEARGLVTRRQFGVLIAAGAAMMLPEVGLSAPHVCPNCAGQSHARPCVSGNREVSHEKGGPSAKTL